MYRQDIENLKVGLSIKDNMVNEDFTEQEVKDFIEIMNKVKDESEAFDWVVSGEYSKYNGKIILDSHLEYDMS